MAKFGKSKDLLEDNSPQQAAEPIAPLDAKSESKPILRSDIAADRIRQERKLPLPPSGNIGGTVSFVDMIDWMTALTSKQFERLTIYIYRTYPIVDLKKIDKDSDKYIDKPVEIPTKQYMLVAHGGGEYQFKVNDIESQKTYFESNLTIPLAEALPKIDLRTLVAEHKNNKPYLSMLRSEGKIDANGNIIENPNKVEAKPVGLDPNALVDKLFTMQADQQRALADQQRTTMAELKRTLESEKAGANANTQLIIEMMKANDPTKTMTAMLNLIPKPEKDNSVAVMMPLLIEMMKNSQQQMLTMFQMMQTKNETPAKDPWGSFEKMFAFVESKMKGTIQNSAEETTTDKIIGAVERIGLPLIEVVMNAATAKKAIESGKPIPEMKPVTQIPNMGPIDPYSASSEQLKQMAEINTRPMPGMPVDLQHTPQELVDLMNKFKPILVNAIVNSKTDGATFAESLEQFIGAEAVSKIIAFGPAIILQSLQQIPDLWTVLAPTQAEAEFMKEWVDEFVNYRQILEVRGNE